MILLTIIAVGLLTLSSISLRATAGTAAMAEARNNARLALMLALGELQKQAGPDQRITATADIAGNEVGLSLPPATPPANDMSINNIPKGLSSVLPGTRYWTGVWKNSNTTNPRVDIYTKTPSPTFQQWLISGNETGSELLTPSSTICALSSDGRVSDPEKAVVLVGRNSAGDPSTQTLAEYVAAPLVEITAANGKETGRYGWWVGDEGVKAKLNIPRSIEPSDSYASLAAQRRGWEAVDGFKDYPIPSAPGHGSLPNVITLQEASLLFPSAGEITGGRSPLQTVFHSATADSRAVLADTLNGGTKIDLTAILSAPTLPTTSPTPLIPNYPVRNSIINPRVGSGRPIAPKWEAVKEFYDRSKNLEGGELIVKAATSNDTASIAPLITDFRLLMGVKLVPGDGGVPGYKANSCGKFAVAIANPYSKTLKWKNDLEFEVINLTPSGNSPSRIWNVGAPSAYISTSEAAVFNKTIFRIRSSSLEPGQARAYTIVGSHLRAAGSLLRMVVDLAPFGSAGPLDFKQCVELDSTRVFNPAPPAMDVRESWQTTLIGVEMRLAGSSGSAQPLRRLSGFDLDNGYFSSNIRNYDAAGCKLRPHPIPLMCFSFQLSQPGVDYLSVMPGGSAMGQRSSTLRTFADFNLQATRISKAITSYNPPPYFMESNNGFAQLPDNPSGQCGNAFVKNLDSIMPWGRNWTGSQKTVLFSVPSQFTSLAQLQHADLTGDDVESSVGHQPGNAFGNSYAPPFVKRGLTIQPRINYVLLGSAGRQSAIETPRNYYDISYHLNASIWDSYFLSTINSGSADLTPENPTLIRLNSSVASPELKDSVACASHLMVDGAFNVNSTDKNAWKAFAASPVSRPTKNGTSWIV